MKSPLFHLLPVLIVLTFKAYTQAGIAVGQMQGCDNQIEAFMTKWNLPGTTFALAKNGKLMYMRGFGYHDLAQTDSVQPYHLSIPTCHFSRELLRY